MFRVKKLFKNLTHIQKISCLIGLLIFFLVIIMSIPTLAKLKNRSSILNEFVWDGSMASKYRAGTGTSDDPYIISNGSELLYFSNQLQNTNYENIYFKLGSDIILNDGTLLYDEENGIRYILDDVTYYVEGVNYYDNTNRTGNPVGIINSFPSLCDFKGNFDASSYVIYGLYMYNNEADEISLFKNLYGNISNLYLENALIRGGTIAGGIASTSDGATISNSLFSGYVISNLNNKIYTQEIESKEINVNALTSTETISLPTINIIGKIQSISLRGEYSILDTSDDVSISINNNTLNNNTFEINLGNQLLDNIDVIVNSTLQSNNITLNNLEYQITYSDSISGGLVGQTKNTIISNSINKAQIYSNNISGGIVGNVKNSLQISNTYNRGQIKSNNISGGIVGQIINNDDVVSFTKIYNDSEIDSVNSGGLIGISKNNAGGINIINSFDTSSNYTINTNLNTLISVTNSYNTNNLSVLNGNLTSNFIFTSLSNLKTAQFVINNLHFNEYMSLSNLNNNVENLWIFEVDSLPILYIDNITKPVACINISSYSFNNYAEQLNVLNLSEEISFTIDKLSETINIKEKYYYISTSSQLMSKSALNSLKSWQLYDNSVNIQETGYYIIYAKIVDYNNNVYYINTDVLAINLLGLTININIGNKNWNSSNSNVSNYYISKRELITISAEDDLLEITNVEYYISQEELSNLSLENITNWNTYISPFSEAALNKFILYVKITDSNGVVTYANTDFIIYSGYTEEVSIDNSNSNSLTSYIFKKSSISYNFSTEELILFKTGYFHSFVCNFLLPEGTVMTLIKDNKVYKYEITSSEDLYSYEESCLDSNCTKEATYSFSLFKEVGTTQDFYYDETDLINTILNGEEFKLIVDFSKINTRDNYEGKYIYSKIQNEEGETIYSTLESTIYELNTSSLSSQLYISSSFVGSTINYNSSSTTNIPLMIGIQNGMLNNEIVCDDIFANKKIGIFMQVYNNDNQLVPGEKLKNIIINHLSTNYYFDSEGTIKINLDEYKNAINTSISLITSLNEGILENGIYYLKIYSYASYDGYILTNQSTSLITIPLLVTNHIINNQINFNVDLNKSSISKLESLENISFNVMQPNNLLNSSIRVSLYEKKHLTAFNQEYILVDLIQYVNNTLQSMGNNSYNVNNIREFLFDTSKFNNNGYKLVFELYDGNTLISLVEKYIIAR